MRCFCNSRYFSCVSMKTYILFFIMCFFSHGIKAEVLGVPIADNPCPPGSILIEISPYGCWSSAGGRIHGTTLWGAGAKFTAGTGVTLTLEFVESYPPFNGAYRFREHICQSTTTSTCSIMKTTTYIDAQKAVTLSASKTISSQNPNFGGNGTSLSLPYSFNMCFTLVDDNDHEWAIPGEGLMCQDASSLPKVPAECMLNYGDDMDVNFGTIERSAIPTSVQYGSNKNIKKTFQVLLSILMAIKLYLHQIQTLAWLYSIKVR